MRYYRKVQFSQRVEEFPDVLNLTQVLIEQLSVEKQTDSVKSSHSGGVWDRKLKNNAR